MKRLLITLILLGCLVGLAACHTSQQVQVVRETLHDTLYNNTVRYDSVFIDQTRETRMMRDTVFRDVSRIEYRLRLVHDTTLVSRRDTIPVTVITEKRVPYTPWWCKVLSGIGVGCLLAGCVIIYKSTNLHRSALPLALSKKFSLIFPRVSS